MRSRFFTLIVLLLVGIFAYSQDTAQLTGTVHDNSGAAIPNATVTVTNLATGIAQGLKTNSSGEYLASGLQAGSYMLQVAASGFSKYEAKDVILRVAQKARVDVELSVQKVNTEVVVTGEGTAQVETQSSEVAGTVTGKELTQLQLNGRNFTQLVTLVPGVLNQTGQDEGQVGINGNVQYSINGGRVEYNDWELDGGDNMDNGSNTTLNVYPSIEAIAEVRVLTSNYGAQYGRNASGTIEVETKSGTNKFHGSAYEFVRNEMFNARSYFDPVDQGAPPYKKNDFGYTVGGPLIKNKTFFFWSQEWRKERVPTTFNLWVPSNANRQGNFSDVCSWGVECPIDPATGAPFAGNQVPLDPNAQALLNMIPQANTTELVDVSEGGTPNMQSVPFLNATSSDPINWREELVRVDHNIGSKHRLTFRYIHDSWDTITSTVVPWNTSSSFPTIKTNFAGPGSSVVAKAASTLSPTLVNEFVASYTSDHIFMKNIGPWQRPSSFTATALFPTNGGKLPGVVVATNGLYGSGFTEDPSFIPWNNANPTYTFRDNVFKNIGKHNLTFGGYFVAAQKNEFANNDIQGLMTFDSNSPVSTGNGFADLLMGNLANFQQSNAQPKYYFRYKIFEPYFQDDWRVTDRLTLNLGLRVSLFGTYRERYKQVYNFEPGAFQSSNIPTIDADGSVTGQAGALVPGTGTPYNGVVQCGAPGVPPGCMKGHLFNPAPRIGFAYDPFGNGKTAIRGGYGIFYEHTNGNEANAEVLEATPPLVTIPTQYNIQGYTNIGGQGLLFPLDVLAIPTKVTWPYMQQWHLDVQREVLRDTVVTVSYVGSKGTHLTLQRNLNQLTVLPASQNPFGPGQALDPNVNCPSDPTPTATYTVNGNVIADQAVINRMMIACGGDPNLVRQFYPGLGNITSVELAANSIYNAFQATARRTMGALTLSLAYTWSHSIDDSSDRYDNNFVDSYNLARTRASSNFDQRHVLTASWVYDLPFFKAAPGLTGKLLGGWQFSGIATVQTGTPFSVVDGILGDNAGVANAVGTTAFADLVGDPNANVTPGSGRAPELYNPDAFANPQGLTFGNVPRNYLRNPNRWNIDSAVYKVFKITEGSSLQFRAEAFNVFNHTQWSAVDNTLGSGTFLQPVSAHLGRIMQFGLKFAF